jgi:hypothetical protein
MSTPKPLQSFPSFLHYITVGLISSDAWGMKLSPHAHIHVAYFLKR